MRTLARTTDPITSHMAASRVKHFAGTHNDQIINALQQQGQATPEEISCLTGLSIVQIDRRLPELQRSNRARVVTANGVDIIRNGYRVWEKV